MEDEGRGGTLLVDGLITLFEACPRFILEFSPGAGALFIHYPLFLVFSLRGIRDDSYISCFCDIYWDK